jgi:hypothetical protein
MLDAVFQTFTVRCVRLFIIVVFIRGFGRDLGAAAEIGATRVLDYSTSRDIVV